MSIKVKQNIDRDEEHEIAVWVDENEDNYINKRGVVWHHLEKRALWEEMVRKYPHLFRCVIHVEEVN